MDFDAGKKLPLESYLHLIEEGLQKINSQLDLLANSPNLAEKDVCILNQAREDTKALIMLSATPLDHMKREKIRIQRPIVTHFEFGEESADCAIKNVGPGGALIWSDKVMDKGNQITVNFPEIGDVDCVVTAISPAGTHLAFEHVSAAKSVAIMELVVAGEQN